MTLRQVDKGWLVEEVDTHGGVHQAFFSGPHARERAEEYLLWKQPARMI